MAAGETRAESQTRSPTKLILYIRVGEDGSGNRTCTLSAPDPGPDPGGIGAEDQDLETPRIRTFLCEDQDPKPRGSGPFCSLLEPQSPEDLDYSGSAIDAAAAAGGGSAEGCGHGLLKGNRFASFKKSFFRN